MRKSSSILVLFFWLLFSTGIFAQTDLTGTWQGKLAISPNEKITIQFILARQPNGSYTALLNSPDSGAIKNVPATGVKLAGNILTVDVASLSGSYSGAVGKGAITGEWKQEGAKLPLVLTTYKAPSVTTLKRLVGEWVGEATPPGAGKTVAVFRFQITKDGKFAGFVDLPEGGVKDLPLADIMLDGDQLSFRIPAVQGNYEGKVIGARIEGAVKQGGGASEVKLNLSKGKYEPPAFSVPPEAIKRLGGEWAGYTGPNKLSIVFRFEVNRNGKLGVFMDVPDQHVKGVAARDFALNGNDLTIKLPGPANDIYTGTLSGDSMKGTFKLNNLNQELNLTKGAYRPGINDMAAEDVKRLVGEWVGKYGPGGPSYTIIWKFHRTTDGKLSAIAAAPETGPDEFPMTDVSLKGDQLSLRIPGTGGEFTGKIANNSLSGIYKAGGAELPMTIVRGAKYEKPTTQVDIPGDSMKKLMGSWNGTIGPLKVSFRFEKNAAGKLTVLHDIPTQNVKDMLVVKASMKESDLSMTMPDGSNISLKLNGNRLDGTLKQNTTTLPVSLSKRP